MDLVKLYHFNYLQNEKTDHHLHNGSLFPYNKDSFLKWCNTAFKRIQKLN